MKKIFLLFLVALFFVGFQADAVTLKYTNYVFEYGVFDNNLNNNPEDQARMLSALGLFRETSQGFELDKAVTRCEAAVLLARFMGEEEKVLISTWKHPFTDVPAWANNYIGWVYQNGFISGIENKKYGSGQNITYLEFVTLLSRALTGSDSFLTGGFVTEQERRYFTTDRALLRGGAVGLFSRALGWWHNTKNNEFMTAAQLLVRKNVFTPDQLGEACWGVLPSQYCEIPESDGTYLTRYVSGVPVAKCAEKNLYISQASISSVLDYIYASRVSGFSRIELLKIDGKTMKTRIAGVYESYVCMGLDYIGSIGGRDYLIERNALEYGILLRCGALISCEDDQVSVAVSAADLWGNDAPNFFEFIKITSDNALAVQGADRLFVISEADIKSYEMSSNAEILYFDGKSIVTQLVTDTDTTIFCIDAANGFVVDSYKVIKDMEYNTRTISHKGYGRLFGEAGLYQVDIELGRLRQITERPVVDVIQYRMDFRPIILTHDIGKRIGGTHGNLGGDQIILIDDDGTEKVLLGPGLGLQIAGFTYGEGGHLGFYTARPVGMENYDIYYYSLSSNVEIWVTGFEPGRPEPPYGSDTLKEYIRSCIVKEQARLDALGY